jgi:hypothetical protein
VGRRPLSPALAVTRAPPRGGAREVHAPAPADLLEACAFLR